MLIKNSPDGVHSSRVVLIIEDDAPFRLFLRDILTLAGYQVLEADNGRQGLQLFQKTRPCLVLLDILMPEQDGIETVQAIKKIDRSAVVFTMTSGEWGENNSMAAQLLGAKRSFFKPFSADQLFEAIQEELSE